VTEPPNSRPAAPARLHPLDALIVIWLGGASGVAVALLVLFS
jgi:hypothetical protein